MAFNSYFFYSSLLILLLLGFFLPYIQDGFGQESAEQSLNIGSEVQTAVEENSISSMGLIVERIVKVGLWTFGDLPFWLDFILLLIRLIFWINIFFIVIALIDLLPFT